MSLRSLAGGQLFADLGGSGTPLVVGLHGWRRDRHDLKVVLSQVEGRVAAFDLPGFGAAPPPPVAWGAADYARLVADGVDELLASADPADGDACPVVVVGHSLGGRVGVCLAALRPDLVRGLVLAGVPLLRRPPGGKAALRFRVARAVHRRGLLSESRMERLRLRYGSADYVAATGVMRQVLVRMVGESYEQELGHLRCPVALVWGESDTAAPLDVARRARDLVPSCTLDVAAGVGHDVHLEAPELIVERVAELSKGREP